MAQTLSVIANEDRNFHEAELGAARAWLAAGEDAYARHFARRLAEDGTARDSERLFALEILEATAPATRTQAPPPVNTDDGAPPAPPHATTMSLSTNAEPPVETQVEAKAKANPEDGASAARVPSSSDPLPAAARVPSSSDPLPAAPRAPPFPSPAREAAAEPTPAPKPDDAPPPPRPPAEPTPVGRDIRLRALPCRPVATMPPPAPAEMPATRNAPPGASLPPVATMPPPRAAQRPQAGETLLSAPPRHDPELVESLPLPLGASEELLAIGNWPTTALQARTAMTRLARSLARDYRLWYGTTLRCNVLAVDAMQRHLAQRYAGATLDDAKVLSELQRHGALLSEILARRLGAEWVDIATTEPGYWAMFVAPETRCWPIGRVYRFVSLSHRERDLVSYFLDVEARTRR